MALTNDSKTSLSLIASKFVRNETHLGLCSPPMLWPFLLFFRSIRYDKGGLNGVVILLVIFMP